MREISQLAYLMKDLEEFFAACKMSNVGTMIADWFIIIQLSPTEDEEVNIQNHTRSFFKNKVTYVNHIQYR